MYVALLIGAILLSCIVVFFKYSRRYNKVDDQFGKPYKARLVKLIGVHPDFKSGIYSMAFHPNGAISLNQRVIMYSDIKEVEIIERREKGDNSRHYLVLLLQDKHGENEVYLTAKTEFADIANELKRAWLKSKIC